MQKKNFNFNLLKLDSLEWVSNGSGARKNTFSSIYFIYFCYFESFITRMFPHTTRVAESKTYFKKIRNSIYRKVKEIFFALTEYFSPKM